MFSTFIISFITNITCGLACFAFGGLGCGLGGLDGLGGLLGGGGCCSGGGGSCCSSIYTTYKYAYAPRRCCGGYGYSNGGSCCGRGYGGYNNYNYYGVYGGGGDGCCNNDFCRRRRFRVSAAKTFRLNHLKNKKIEQMDSRKHISYERYSSQLSQRLDTVHPDQLFADCCRAFNLSTSCKNYCNYRNYTVETLQHALLGMPSTTSAACRLDSISALHFCASGNRDHRRCCRAANVDNTIAGAKCLLFCQPMTDKMVNLDLSYLPCLEKANAMRKCFYDNALEFSRYLTNRPTNEF